MPHGTVYMRAVATSTALALTELMHGPQLHMPRIHHAPSLMLQPSTAIYEHASSYHDSHEALDHLYRGHVLIYVTCYMHL